MNEALLWGALLIAMIAAAWDIWSRRIPNALCLLLALTSLAWSASSGLTPELMGALAHFAIALGIGLLLFSLRWIGGGDAKFYAAAALAIPLSKAPIMLVFTSISGLVLVLAMLALPLLRGKKSQAEWRRLQVPYGVAIFIGFATTAIRTVLWN